MSGDAHVRFWESEGAQFPFATHPFGNPGREPISATFTPAATLSVGGMPLVLSPSGQGKVTIPAGKSSVAIRLAVAPDSLLEWDETVRISLLPTPAGSTPYCISLASAGVTILDDESIGGMFSRNVDSEGTGLTPAWAGRSFRAPRR